MSSIPRLSMPLSVDREPASAYGSVGIPQNAGGPGDAKPLTFDRLRCGMRRAVVLLRRAAFRARWTNPVQGALRLLPRHGPRACSGPRSVEGDVAGASA